MKKLITSLALSVLVISHSQAREMEQVEILGKQYNTEKKGEFIAMLANEKKGLSPYAAKALDVVRGILESPGLVSETTLQMKLLPYSFYKKELASHFEKLKKDKKIVGKHIEILDKLFAPKVDSASFAEAAENMKILMVDIAKRIDALKKSA